MSAFSPLLRNLSNTYRWGTKRVIQRQNVAEHSFYVLIYAYQIALNINWQGSMWELLETSCMHDIGESVTGDILGPVKRDLINKDCLTDYIKSQIDWIVIGENEEIGRIIKCANLVDESFYIAGELHCGNESLRTQFNDVRQRLYLACKNLPTNEETCEKLWGSIMENIDAHLCYQNVTRPNNSDVDLDTPIKP